VVGEGLAVSASEFLPLEAVIERVEVHPSTAPEHELVDLVGIVATIDGVAHVGEVGGIEELREDAPIGLLVGR